MWRLIGISLVIGIILYFVSAIVGSITQLPADACRGLNDEPRDRPDSRPRLTAALALLQTVLTYSYLCTVATLIYVDLRIRTEGFDVDLARAAEARSAR